MSHFSGAFFRAPVSFHPKYILIDGETDGGTTTDDTVIDDTTTNNNPFKDKWVSILGDSISTYTGYIPSGNAAQYPDGDLTDVSKTWWHQLLTKLGAKLCVNQSYCGRNVCGDANNDAVNAYGTLHRVKGTTYINLDGSTEEATANIQPDIILILLGVNDFYHEKTLGEYSETKASGATTDFYSAYNYMLLKLIGYNYLKAQTYCLSTPYMDKFSFMGKNTNNNLQLDFNRAIKKEARLYGVHFINLSNLCIHSGNNSTYLIDKIHPKANMMTMMANQCYHSMMADNCL